MFQIVPMCSNVFQCVPMCSSVFQCVPVCSSVFQCVPVCSNVFQCVPVCPNVLQYVPMCSSVFQYVPICSNVFQCVPVCSDVFHCVPMCSSVFQCVPICSHRYVQLLYVAVFFTHFKVLSAFCCKLCPSQHRSLAAQYLMEYTNSENRLYVIPFLHFINLSRPYLYILLITQFSKSLSKPFSGNYIILF